MSAVTCLRWSSRAVEIGGEGGGIVGLRHNLLKKEWMDMCRAAYTPDAVTNELKIHGVAASGETPTT